MVHDREDHAGRGGEFDASSLRGGDGEGSDGDGSQRDVDEDIDELLSDEDEDGDEGTAGGAGSGAAGGTDATLLPYKKPSARGRRRRKDRWVCEWDHCGTEMPDEQTLVKHLHEGESCAALSSPVADVWVQTMWEAGGMCMRVDG